MAERTNIEWCDHTFVCWEGCQEVSPACNHCYAKARDQRFHGGIHWGPHAERRRTSEANWKKPLLWNKKAAAAGIRRRVFCTSLGDVFDNQVPPEWRADLWRVIDETPNLDWLLLTKRPQNAAAMIEAARRSILCDFKGDAKHVAWPWPQVWLGTTAENQEEADRRIPHLLRVPATVHFLSVEPMLGPLDLRQYLEGQEEHGVDLTREVGAKVGCAIGWRPPVDWVIAGGESGPDARPCHPDWLRSIRDQCAIAGVPYFLKQWGEWVPHTLRPGGDLGGDVRAGRVRIVHPSGRDDVEILRETDGKRQTEPGSRYMERVGKKRAGAMLDGREHREFPHVSDRSGA